MHAPNLTSLPFPSLFLKEHVFFKVFYPCDPRDATVLKILQYAPVCAVLLARFPELIGFF